MPAEVGLGGLVSEQIGFFDQRLGVGVGGGKRFWTAMRSWANEPERVI